jgi:hypothetical protein
MTRVDSLVRPLALEHDGKVVKHIGDALMLAFRRADDAVTFAGSVHKAAYAQKSGALRPPENLVRRRPLRSISQMLAVCLLSTTLGAAARRSTRAAVGRHGTAHARPGRGPLVV